MAFSNGSIIGYNDALHNETTLGVQSTLLAADANLMSGPSRIVAAGLRVRSLAAVLNDSGVM
jgi:hypothetical protein